MKFQPRRFVVEVKRGTNRAAFTSPDTVSRKFSAAEDLLFGAPRTAPVQVEGESIESGKASGRILKSLVEPAPPVIADEPPPVRRGRKPGSKNKPKPAPVAADSILVPPPARRGRKPGSKNKPKTSPVADDFMLWPERAEEPAPPPERELPAVAAEAAPAPPAADRLETRRPRLRERSGILKRYVLGTEPRPGQAGYLRALRAARQS